MNWGVFQKLRKRDLCLFLLVGAGAMSAPVQGSGSEGGQISDLDWNEAVLSQLEERLLELEAHLVAEPQVGLGVGHRTASLFAPRVLVRSTSDPFEVVPHPAGGRLDLRSLEWGVAVPIEVERSKVAPWSGALELFARVESARVSMVRGHGGLDPNGNESFSSDHYLKVRGRTESGAVLSLRGGFSLRWQRSAEAPWQIVELSSDRFAALEAPRPLFEDVTEVALPGALADRLQSSPHQDYVRQYLEDPIGFKPPHRQFQAISHDRHPALSVVDIDKDGWDDLYVGARLGKNQLLRNQGDGTFEEVAERYALDLDGLTSCALFLDFDNDGDLDAFICRSLERSLLLLNQDGTFVDHSELSKEPLPSHVTSASAADYDGDGDLDLYLATYAKTQTRGWKLDAVLTVDPSLPMPDRATFAEMEQQDRSWTNSYGPANVLLRNLGNGGFERAGLESGATIWRHTFQASWSDYDLDGDQDLYLANDYAPNNLLRNLGDGTFEDMSRESGTEDRGFGMGASWGDFDRDGLPDLYVSNMYSKAGRRITSELVGSDSKLAEMSRGNSLLRNGPTGFDRISDQADFQVTEKTGWSWGGQFLDFDNDGWLDLAVLNGYYTVPADLRKLPVDT